MSEVLSEWRHLPAETVEEIITQHIGRFPPTQQELVALLESHRYTVTFAKAYSGQQAQSYHHARKIIIPHGRPEWMLALLLHETAEALLRLPVAPEFIYPTSQADEFHNVATLAADRLVRRIDAERDDLLRQEEEEENAVFRLYDTIREITDRMGTAIEAMRRRDHSVRMPESGELQETNDQLNAHSDRLRQIQARLVALSGRV